MVLILPLLEKVTEIPVAILIACLQIEVMLTLSLVEVAHTNGLQQKRYA